MSYNVYLSLGSNIEPENYIPRTVLRLNQDYELKAVSSVYRTAPVKMVEGADEFHNLCLEIETDREPDDLKQELRDLEKEMGRERSDDTDLYQPRVIDIDIILYEPSPLGFAPHEQLFDEAFVVYPMSEILDPVQHEELPNEVSTWKADCDESIVLGRLNYDWPEAVDEFVR